MSCRGVTLHTRAASAAESRSRWMTSPSFAMSTWARMSCASASATSAPLPCPASSRSQEATSVRVGSHHVNKSDRWLIPDHDARSWLAGGPLPRALRSRQRLPIRHFHAHVVARDAAGAQVGPLPGDLDGDRLDLLAGALD